MNDTAWLKQVLADAKAAKQRWPDWAKDRVAHNDFDPNPEALCDPKPAATEPQSAKGNQNASIKLI